MTGARWWTVRRTQLTAVTEGIERRGVEERRSIGRLGRKGGGRGARGEDGGRCKR